MIDFTAIGSAVLEQLKYNPTSPLIFSSGLFLFVFCLFSLFYPLFQKRYLGRILYLTLFSLFFYYKTSGVFFLLLVGLSISDYTLGYFMARVKSRLSARLIVGLSISINIGLLCYFKYTNFFIKIINDISGENWLDFQSIFLPVGVSFFTFQSMSYIIDLYRKEITPVKRWIDYLFYLSFFPQLVAGPIVRAKDFLPQIYRSTLVTKEMFNYGFFLILTGLFKKAIISDYISLNFVDRVFDAPLLYSGFENLMGVYAYALQIYCDFSGYSDMAIGIALILGFHFPKNFDSPYKSATITEFWRRWHISLSSWLRDYLYISLGGNRKGKLRTYVNLSMTMLLGGLWHGAAMRFVLWGALHGVALAVHKFTMTMWSSFKADGSQMSLWRRFIGIFITFHVVCLSWILFRADNMETVKQVLSQIFTDFRFKLIPEVIIGYKEVFLLFTIGYVLHFTRSKMTSRFRALLDMMPLLVKAIMLALLIWTVMQIKSSTIQPFIYFQF